MRKINTKKTAAVVAPLVILGIAGVAYANTLGVSSDILGGGNDSVDNNCSIQASYKTDDASNVSWHAPTATAPAGYYLDAVTVTATGTECAGATFRLTATDSGKNQISEYNGTLEAEGPKVVTLGSAVQVDRVTNLYAVVTKAKANS